jgi:hypothetical protein
MTILHYFEMEFNDISIKGETFENEIETRN